MMIIFVWNIFEVVVCMHVPRGARCYEKGGNDKNSICPQILLFIVHVLSSLIFNSHKDRSSRLWRCSRGYPACLYLFYCISCDISDLVTKCSKNILYNLRSSLLHGHDYHMVVKSVTKRAGMNDKNIYLFFSWARVSSRLTISQQVPCLSARCWRPRWLNLSGCLRTRWTDL